VPRKGTWAEISGDDLLKKLLCMVRARVPPTRATRLTLRRLFALRRQEMQSIDNPYTGDRLTIDPRNLAQRILEARARCTALRSAAVWGLLAGALAEAYPRADPRALGQGVRGGPQVCKGAPAATRPLLQTAQCAHRPPCFSAEAQDENADMLREALQCSLKLPSMEDSGDIDDDGRPIVKKQEP
jgi:hypothetical protein